MSVIFHFTVAKCSASKHSVYIPYRVINVLIIEKQYLNCSNVWKILSLRLSSINYDCWWENAHTRSLRHTFWFSFSSICFNNSCWLSENVIRDVATIFLNGLWYKSIAPREKLRTNVICNFIGKMQFFYIITEALMNLIKYIHMQFIHF